MRASAGQEAPGCVARAGHEALRGDRPPQRLTQ